ncbi:DNA polymerase III, delta subunit [Desulfacinum hydrothermale DSM 13146]|uniref:DNA polymerase III subunit delta n=1 Tax=Desulfacinum hydrothermale DSM 13146 TaxID=1121390 RepID=A0A1W1XLY2_9BACT|nr:DNA polymerase III subunit delta [Desulfacinum hydrothermale]SMC24885.1 DNA polymerase III, delta subunit [Desulfacinum hydrothermale DSM 13146]
MDSRAFIESLQQPPTRPVYLFKGAEPFLMDQAWQALVEALGRSVKTGRIKGERFSAKDVSAADVAERLRTLSVFTPLRVVLVRDVEAWTKDQREILHGYLRKPNPRSCLVLSVAPKKAWKELERLVQAHGAVVDFKGLNERQIPSWVRDRAASQGKRISLTTAGLLAAKVGTDLQALERELEKLSLYVGDRPEILDGDVDAAVAHRHSDNIFKLMDYVGEKRPAEAFLCLRGLLQAGDAPLSILALLARQVRLAWQVKDGLERGQTVAQLAKTLRLPPFVVEKHARQAQRFSHQALGALHSALLHVDLRLKTTALDPEKALESLIYRFCT